MNEFVDAGLRELVRRQFLEQEEFLSSPLYRALSRAVADDPFLVALAARARPGQHPTFLFFGAVHHLLLGGADDELRGYYASMVGTAAGPPAEAGPALRRFAERYEAELASLVENRLVQSNVVNRAVALRFGMAVVRTLTDAPVHLVEIGASAGIHLRFDRYRYLLGGRSFGDPSSRVSIDAEWRGRTPVPDLDLVPTVLSTTGIDLRPIDARDEDACRWLRALVWPENLVQAEQLSAALEIVAGDPPPIHAGDAVDLCPRLARQLPAGATRLAFHAATRMHVPRPRRPDFDAAIGTLGHDGPLYWLAFEGPLAAGGDPRWDTPGITLSDPDGGTHHLANADGHGAWITPTPHDEALAALALKTLHPTRHGRS